MCDYFFQTDCLGEEGLRLLPDKCVDMVLCDPPYGVTSRNSWDVPLDLNALFAELDRIVKPKACVVFFSQGMLTADLMRGPWSRYWRYNLVWKKNKPRGFLNAKKMPLRYHEDIVVFYKETPLYYPQMIETGKAIHQCTRKSNGSNYGESRGGVNERTGKTDRYPGSVLEFSVVNKPIHPTEKPVDLCEFLILSYTKEEDVVLDMCAGSGTTGVACAKNRRYFIGYEKEENFYNLAKERIMGV
ncbi:DNA-adenine methyltransferase [Cedratvirus kamchatka]|uniref:DNA-adenine methyltransferase n=1 Tax=Cedratvirus kamchatka TaxID=2716914 RepID=A0A6G8MY31_9VIRU|nr:DNA-adenine methyltransferase [Cedratvirus kamchatka]